MWSPTAKKIEKEDFVMKDNNSLAHSTWNCKYHLVFAPKYRRMVFYKNKKTEVGKIQRKLCEWKGVPSLDKEIHAFSAVIQAFIAESIRESPNFSKTAY